MCVFVSGLKDICNEDGAIAMVVVVDNPRASSMVKICVANRPVTVLEHLQNNQHIRLQLSLLQVRFAV